MFCESLESRRLMAKPEDVFVGLSGSIDGGTLTVTVFDASNPKAKPLTFTFTDELADGTPTAFNLADIFKLKQPGKPSGDPLDLRVSWTFEGGGQINLATDVHPA